MIPTAVIVAILAAVASVGSAVVAYRAAGRANRSSEMIARESHGVEAIDRQSDELREAFNRFVEVFAEVHDLNKQLQVTARLDQLASCLGSTDGLDAACSTLSESIRAQSVIHIETTRAFGQPNFSTKMRNVSTEYRNAQKELSGKRAAALSAESK